MNLATILEMGGSAAIIRELTPDDWETWRSLRRAALADAPEAFGSTLADWSGDGDAEHRWRSRLASVPLNLIALADGVPVAMASGTALDDGDVGLISMWCAPEARGHGFGGALVESVASWARAQGARRLLLDVRSGNLRAIDLYLRHGFVDVGWSTPPGAEPGERRMVRELVVSLVARQPTGRIRPTRPATAPRGR